MANKFSWIPFYKELADELKNWENRQKELIQFLEDLRQKGFTITPLNDIDELGNKFLLNELDPFTFFGVFNRRIKEKERLSILSEIKKKFKISSELPNDFSGIPILNNMSSRFFGKIYKRKKDDIQKLWIIFKLALLDDAIDIDKFYNAFDEAVKIYRVNVNLTMGLYWIRPDKFLNLDQTNRSYLNIKLPPQGLNSKFYLDIRKKISTEYNSPFYQISYDAYNSGKMEDPPNPTENNYWFVGAYWEDEDQLERFLDEGIWENGYKDKYTDEVNSMKAGDKIAIKATSTQKHNLPFNNQGNTISKMAIKAKGTIIANRQDGRTVEVEWDDNFELKEWFFFTYMKTVWRLNLDTDYKFIEYSTRLFEFVWKDKPQDYEWFLDKWFNEEVKDVSANYYSLDDILDEGVFLKKKELENFLTTLLKKKNIIIQGSPGVGKTFLSRKLAYALIEEANSDYIEMVQFHQSYSYEDFVQGFRPSPDNGGNFVLKDGIFYKFCEKARNNPDKKYVFIIDEINRGNISQIFGELLMLIEADKRNSNYSVPLMYSEGVKREQRFYIPPNLYIIGLMNTADRSLALIDYALRRRFAFFTLTPKFDSNEFYTWLKKRNMDEELITLIRNRMSALNNEIEESELLGGNFVIGHSYFCPKNNDYSAFDRQWYENIIKSEIVPLLKEYWFDDQDAVENLHNALISQ